jgi:cell division protein FtsL
MDRQIIVHKRRWKLLIDQALDLRELYDRASDPDEYLNLASEPAAQAQHQRLEQAAIRSLMDGCLA